MSKTIMLLFSIFAMFLASGCRINPVTGARELSLVSEQQELAMGREAHPSLVMMYDDIYTGEEELTAYLEAIVERIHSVSHRREMPVRFTLLNSSVVNAFALPGHVYATRGLLIELENEAQFATIMAHEMGHVAAGHSAQRMTRQMVTELGMGLGGYALEDVRGAGGIMLAGQAGILLSQLSYSRSQERQADRLSAYYAAQAGWDPKAAIEVQHILKELSGREETVLDRYLSTHPPASERIADLRSLIDSGELPLHRIEGDGVFAGRWSERTKNIRAVQAAYEKYDKATVALERGELESSLVQAKQAVDIKSDQAPFYRLKGDILLRKERYADSRADYEKSLDLNPDYAHAVIGLGYLALEEGKYEEAEQRFNKASEKYPAAFSAKYGLGLARYNQGKYGAAVGPLREVARSAPDNADLFYVLAACYDRTGHHQAARDSYAHALEHGLQEPRRGEALKRLEDPVK